MANNNLTNAKRARNDEFYTQYQDIEKEVAAYVEFNPDVFRGKTVLLPCDNPEWSNFTKYFALNFEALGLKKLISTSYAADSSKMSASQSSLFEEAGDNSQTAQKGRIYTMTEGGGKIDVNDLSWGYLKGDGDFRSEEVSALRDNADIIVTNPPFSLSREFLSWVVKADKQFLVIGNINAITYKEVFPMIKANKIWLGATNFNVGMYFLVPSTFVYADTYKFAREQNDVQVNRVPGVCWFSNIDHGRRHKPLQLMSMENNLQHNKKLKGAEKYDCYDNYAAIEVPFTNAIPCDYEGVMGVPITFLEKYSPEQFVIVGATESEGIGFSNGLWAEGSKVSQPVVNSERVYKRIFIKHKTPAPLTL